MTASETFPEPRSRGSAAARSSYAPPSSPSSAPAASTRPLALPASFSPLVDAEGPGWCVSVATSAVVRLSAWRRRQLATAAAEGRRTLLVTRDGAVLTPALAETLGQLGGAWIVQTDEGLRDAETGIRLASPQERLAPPANPVGAPEHADIPFVESELALHLAVTASIRHRNVEAAPFGAAVPAVAATLLEDPIIDWGLDEPVSLAWDPEAIAGSVRGRLDGGGLTIAAGAGADGRRVVATVRASRTSFGAEETISMKIALGAQDDAAARDRLARSTDALEALGAVGVPLFGIAAAGFGLPTLSRWPWLQLASIPMAFLLGAPAVSRFRLRRSGFPFEERFAAAFVGSRGREALLVELAEEPSPDAIRELRSLVAAIGPEAAAEALDPKLAAGLFGPGSREAIAAERDALLREMGLPDDDGDDRDDARDPDSADDADNADDADSQVHGGHAAAARGDAEERPDGDAL